MCSGLEGVQFLTTLACRIWGGSGSEKVLGLGLRITTAAHRGERVGAGGTAQPDGFIKCRDCS